MSVNFGIEQKRVFHDARDEIKEIISDPFFEAIREDLENAFKEAYKSLRGNPPVNDLEMADLCAMISGPLRGLEKQVSSSDDVEFRVSSSSLLERITKVRTKVRLCFKHHMRREGLWESIDLVDEESAIGFVRKIVSIQLDLPVDAPSKDDPEFDVYRTRLLDMKHKDFAGYYGLSCFLNKQHSNTATFESYADLVSAAFPEYDLYDELSSRRPERTWTDSESLCANVKEAAYEYLGIPMIAPDKDTNPDEWERVRHLILSIDHKSFIEDMDCKEALRYCGNSHYLVLVFVYGEDYELEEELKSKMKNPETYSWSTREETIQNVRNVVGRGTSFENLPEVGTTRWWSLISSFIVSKRDMINYYHLGGGFNKNIYFSSHIDLLVAAFPELDMKPWFFTKWGSKLIAERAKKGIKVAPTMEYKDLCRSLLKGQEDLLADVVDSFYDLGIGARSTLVDESLFKTLASFRFGQSILTMGYFSPVNLERLWRTCTYDLRRALQYRFQSRNGDINDLLPQEPAAE
jgi:hypothetical protein